MSANLFTYGVLMHSELFHALTGKRPAVSSVTLFEFQRYSLEKNGWPRIPVMVQEAGSSVEGALLRDIDDDIVDLLDDFEDVEMGLYVREPVRVVHRSGTETNAFAYLAGPAALGYLSDIWSPEQFLEHHYDEYRQRIIPNFLRERN